MSSSDDEIAMMPEDTVLSEGAHRMVSYIMLAFDVARTDGERVSALAAHFRGLQYALGKELFYAALDQAITSDQKSSRAG